MRAFCTNNASVHTQNTAK